MTKVSELVSQNVGSAITNFQTWGGILYNVKKYGAIGNNIADDTSSVQAAINAAVAANGTLVFFPPGTYKVTSLVNISTINFVGDNATFSGYAGTITEFGVSNITNKVVATPVYNVKGYGAKGDYNYEGAVGNGTDDTQAFLAAIAAAKAAGGGIVFMPKGNYKVNQTLVFDATANVSLQGVGSFQDTATAPTKAISAIVWTGGAGPVILITGKMGGVNWHDFMVDGANIAGAIGISVDQLTYSVWSNITAFRCATGIKMLPVDGGVANQNTMFNTFINLSAIRCGVGIDLNGTGTSNICHNTFMNTQVDYTGTDGLLINDTDNNRFIGVYGFNRGATGFTVRLKASARSNYFFDFEGDIKAESGSKNIVFGFDRENGQPRPTVDAGAQLFWTENGNNAYAWHMSSPIEGMVTLLTGDNTLAVNANTDVTAWKVFRPVTSQLLQWDTTAAGRTAKMTYYDGQAAKEAIPMSLDYKGLLTTVMGGATRTYSATNTMPTTGTWNQGDYVQNNAPTVLGAASSKYVVKGWTRITTGSGNVLNTDWVEDRALTGT